MIKVEHKYLDNRGVDAIAFEASGDKDLKLLDMLYQIFVTKPETLQSYIDTNRFVVHVKGLSDESRKSQG